MASDEHDARVIRRMQLDDFWQAAYRLGYRHGKEEQGHAAYNSEEATLRRNSEVSRQLTEEGLDDA